MAPDTLSSRAGWRLLALALIITVLVYWPGLHGGWLFDDYPNIVDNHGVQPSDASVASLVRAALSSPASDLRRPLASLSFAANYLATGLEPFGWKLVNLLIHLMNGVLVFLLARELLATGRQFFAQRGLRPDVVAALVAGGWMLLPINLTAVLYVVQREESLANVFVLMGLLGYVVGRRRMMTQAAPPAESPEDAKSRHKDWPGLALCIASICISTCLGLTVKETAAMLPLYAFLIECILFRFAWHRATSTDASSVPRTKKDWRLIGLFLVTLFLPAIVGVLWLLPGVLNPMSWATRDFTLKTRLLSEGRVICGYLFWTLFPTARELSFYHDQYEISRNLLAPWTTLTSLLFLVALVAIILWQRQRRPLVSLGLALFLGAQLLTGTIVPLELVYEHRNYFASFGVLLATVPLLVGPWNTSSITSPMHDPRNAGKLMPLAGRWLLGGLVFYWASLTAYTSIAWGEPLDLARELASRGPDSPRAQYELGRAYIIYSHYDPASPYIKPAYEALEKAAAIPASSILPQQALIFMNSRMNLPQKDAWWDSMIDKLKSRRPGVQDESSLSALAQCQQEGRCDLSTPRMTEAFNAALAHPRPTARLLAMYSNYAWNTLGDRSKGMALMNQAVETAPSEPAYRITQVRMLVALGRVEDARRATRQLEAQNIGGSLDKSISDLNALQSER
ncbi:hypothetical protein [Dyella sp. C11]|uniref:tetratricopeptide repeat protein n=1 Tax=Dyella sp. C11 TaxID=2126991 RepID=UPI000D643EA8|nr:hypothetical protein [Dyella sp. C11]